MSQSKRPKRQGKERNATVRFEGDIRYPCEWGNCDHPLPDLQSATKHMSDHLYLYMNGVVLSSTPGTTVWSFQCQWRECGTEVEGSISDFNRHAYFHLFHTRLKVQGQGLMMQRNLQPCLVGAQSRNWIPELPENLQCGWTGCEIIYDNPVLFYGHVNGHCEEYAKGNSTVSTCKWTGCRQKFKSKHKLREHLRSHSQEKVCACPTCGGLFANCTKMVDHLHRQVDSDYHMFQCAHCNKKFATERLLRDHMRHHVNCYKCPFCDMTCSTPANLRLHIKYRHSSEKPYRCGHCPHSCKSAADLRKHLESHSEEENFTCHFPDCQYSTRSCGSLSHHFRKVHQMVDISRYQCHVCQQTFTRGSSLTFHLKIKHKFKWPSGHSRFRYKLEEDGFFRLQTIRYESLDLTSQGKKGQQELDHEDAEEDNEDDNDDNDDNNNDEDEDGMEAEKGNTRVLPVATLLSPDVVMEGEGTDTLELPAGCQVVQVMYQDESGLLTPIPLQTSLSGDIHTYNLQMLGDVVLDHLDVKGDGSEAAAGEGQMT